MQTLPEHVALVPSFPWQYDVPDVPGQHAKAGPPGGSLKHVPPAQQTSVPMFAHVPGAPPKTLGAPVHRPAFVTHAPDAVLQTCPAPHWLSAVHFPHTLGPPAPQTLPFAFDAQSALLQQLPGTHPAAAEVASVGRASARTGGARGRDARAVRRARGGGAEGRRAVVRILLALRVGRALAARVGRRQAADLTAGSAGRNKVTVSTARKLGGAAADDDDRLWRSGRGTKRIRT